MIDVVELKTKLVSVDSMLEGCIRALRIDDLRLDKVKLLENMCQVGFYDDIKRATEVSTALSQIEYKIDKCDRLKKKVNDCLELLELIKQDFDEMIAREIDRDIQELYMDIKELHITTLLSGEYDANNAIVTIHAGAGGTEAQDWADMLYRMYRMYSVKMKYIIKELDYIVGDEAGIKGVTFSVIGMNAYGYLRVEKGVHRLVRISPFDSNARRHTSFASVEVMPEISDVEAIEIRQEDLKIDTYRSGGAGGQHVNKTESAIRITHIPSGIIVACQNERSQIQNRETAMGMLRAKLIEKQEREAIEKTQSIQGTLKKIEWGSQIRSYVFAPYTLVKDHRSGYENSNITAVMDGDIHAFIVDYLEKRAME